MREVILQWFFIMCGLISGYFFGRSHAMTIAARHERERTRAIR